MIRDKKGQSIHERAITIARELEKKYSFDVSFDQMVLTIELDIKYNNGNWVNEIL